MKSSPADWPIASALQTLEDFGGQFKRNVDMRMRKGDVRSAVLRLSSGSVLDAAMEKAEASRKPSCSP